MRKQRLQHRLELQSMQIEQLMAQHHIDGKIVQGQARQTQEDVAIEFDVVSTLNEGLKKIQALKNDILKNLSPSEVSIESEDGQNGRFKLIYQQFNRRQIALLDLVSQIREVPDLNALLGWSPRHKPLLIDFNERETFHLGVFGGRNSGKSHLLRSLILSLSLFNRPAHLQLVIAGNPYTGQQNHAGLKPLSYLPHMATPFMETPGELAEGLAFLVDEVDHRRANQIRDPHIFLVVDDLTLFLHGHDAQNQQQRLLHIARYGQICGIHLVFSAADPENPILHGLMDQFTPSRIVGRVDTPFQAEIATNALESFAERLNGNGDLLAAIGDNLEPFQGAFIDDADLKTCLKSIYEERRPRVVAQTFHDTPSFSPAVKEDEQHAFIKFDHPQTQATLQSEVEENVISAAPSLSQEPEVDDVVIPSGTESYFEEAIETADDDEIAQIENASETLDDVFITNPSFYDDEDQIKTDEADPENEDEDPWLNGLLDLDLPDVDEENPQSFPSSISNGSITLADEEKGSTKEVQETPLFVKPQTISDEAKLDDLFGSSGDMFTVEESNPESETAEADIEEPSLLGEADQEQKENKAEEIFELEYTPIEEDYFDDDF